VGMIKDIFVFFDLLLLGSMHLDEFGLGVVSRFADLFRYPAKVAQCSISSPPAPASLVSWTPHATLSGHLKSPAIFKLNSASFRKLHFCTI